jgi:mRNA interferase YafQ
MLLIRRSSQFKKDLKKIIRQGKNLNLLEDVVTTLQEQKPLDTKHCDHSLTGEWSSYRECHLSPDWLLIYKVEEDLQLLKLMRTGSHSELF